MPRPQKKSADAHIEPEIGQVVLGKLKGFPAWPGKICDPSTANEKVQLERPKATKTPYFLFRFFPTGDYAWLQAKDISQLQTHEIDAFISEPNKKNGELKKGYEVAKDPSEWETEMKAIDEEADEEDDAEAGNEVDELEEDGGADKGKSKKKAAADSKKRKRDAEPKKKPAPKKAAAAKPASGAKTGGKGKGAKSKKSKATVESEDEGEGADGAPAKKKTKKGKTSDKAKDDDPDFVLVKNWRHALQRTFLGNKPIEEADMKGHDELFKTIENYEQISLEQLSHSKIGKVMRHIAALEDGKVPQDDSYQFRHRADVLVHKWQAMANHTNANSANGKAVNGDLNGGDDSMDPLSAAV